MISILSKRSKIRRLLLVKKIKNFFYELFHSNYVILSASVSPVFYNWGDDINPILIELINPSLKAIPRVYSFNFKKKNDYLCIGSVITFQATPHSVIWGSGVQFPEHEITYAGQVIKPYKVLAVRGPLTRKYLLEKGIECPEIYGDPALLLPRYYTPKSQKKYKCGIIPHFKDKESPLVQKLAENNDIHFIDVQNVKDWRYFIEEIASCEFILSSSLHGIIIADTYNVPNSWVEFDRIDLKRFTFRDYFYAVGKNIDIPISIDENLGAEDILKLKQTWQPPVIDLDKLMLVCPFKR